MKFNKIINDSAQQLLKIVNDILDISKIEIGQVELNYKGIYLNQIIKDVISFHSILAQEKGLNLMEFYPTEICTNEIYTDETKLIQILTNLISNAIKFTKNGNIEITCQLSERFIQFCVKDDGIGIALKNHDSVFKRFIQAENGLSRAHSGTGLGLAISKAYVNKLGGEMWLESELNVGSKFYFTIPLIKEVQEN